MRSLFAAELHGLFKGSFPEVGFCPGAPNLDLGDIVDVIRNDDAFVELVALESATFDLQLLQEVSVALGVHYLPMRVWRLRRFEIIRQSQDVLSVFDHMGDGSSVRFCALELAAGVAFIRERVTGYKCQGGECCE